MGIEKNLLGTNIIPQIGLIVKDIEKTSQNYADFFNVEKPDIIETDSVDITHAEFRGKSTDARAKLAFFRFKNLTIELIEPDSGSSTWKEYLNQHGEGVHHIGFYVKNMDEKLKLLKEKNFETVQKGDYTGGRYSYVDTSHVLKIIIELLEND